MSAGSLMRLVLLGAIWGSSFLFMRIAVPEVGPSATIGTRFALATALLGIVALAAGRALDWKRHWRRYLLVAVVNSVIPFWLFAHAAQSLPASVLAVFNSLTPLFGCLFAALWLGVPLTARGLLGLVAGVAGVVLLVGAHTADFPSGEAASRLATSLAMIEATVAAACYALAATWIKRHPAPIEVFAYAQGSMLAACLVSAPLVVLDAPTSFPSGSAVGALAALGLLCTATAYLLQFRLIAEIGTTRMMTVAFLIPMFGILWGMLFLGERFTPTALAGSAMVVIGTWLVLRAPVKA